MKKTNITFCSFPDYSGNAKSLYEYIELKYHDKVNCTWVVFQKDNYEKLKDIIPKVVLVGSKRFLDYIPKTNIFFTTHANLTGDKWKTKGAIYVELWHGIGPKSGGYLLDNNSEKDELWYKHISETIDYFIVPSDFWSVLFSAEFKLPYRRTLSLGYPKLDYYLLPNSKEKLSNVIGTDVKKYNKVIFYMPTFRKGCGRNSNLKYTKNVFNIENYEDDKLEQYLKKNNYLLCVKKHPSEDLILSTEKIISDNIKFVNQKNIEALGYDTSEIISASDVLITDYSSVGVEFLFLNKPVIYISYDLKKYSDQRGIKLNNYDFWCSNRSINSYNELISQLDYYLSDEYVFDETFISKKKLWFDNLVDGGCKNICDYFFNEDGTLKKELSQNEIGVMRDEICKLTESVEQLENKINVQTSLISDLEQAKLKLNQIENSKGWILLEKLRKIKKFRK